MRGCVCDVLLLLVEQKFLDAMRVCDNGKQSEYNFCVYMTVRCSQFRFVVVNQRRAQDFEISEFTDYVQYWTKPK
jgi:hypothetical protein